MDKSIKLTEQLCDLVQLDGSLHNQRTVLTDVNGTTLKDNAASFTLHCEDGRWYEVSVKLVHEPDAEEAESIAHSKAFDLHGRPRR
jgi:hypothetical protein